MSFVSLARSATFVDRKKQLKQWNLHSQTSAVGLLDSILDGISRLRAKLIKPKATHAFLTMDWARTHLYSIERNFSYDLGSAALGDTVPHMLGPWKELWSVLFIAFTCKKNLSRCPSKLSYTTQELSRFTSCLLLLRAVSSLFFHKVLNIFLENTSKICLRVLCKYYEKVLRTKFPFPMK